MRITVSTSKYNYHHRIVADSDLDEDVIHDEKSSHFTGVGTTFYVVPAERLLKALDRSKKKLNKFFVDIIRYLDLDALNVDQFYGSQIDTVNRVLYLCVTDGKSIVVNGEEIDPEKALDKYTIEDLSEYCESPSDDVILKYISVYELDPKALDSDTIDTIVEDALHKGSHFKDIVKDYDELKKVLNLL